MAASNFRKIYKQTDEYVFTTGDSHTLDEQVEFANVGSEGYYVDMTMTPKQFETFVMIQQNYAPSLSVFMHTTDGELVGFSRTAVRGKRAWLAGISLVPKFRGKRVGPILLTEYLELLRTHSEVEHLQFECVKQNERALKMYRNFGCQVGGELLTYHVEFEGEELEKEEVGGEGEDGDRLQMVTEAQNGMMDLRLPWLQHTVPYSWQREFSVLLAGFHRLFLFKRPGLDEVVLAFAVETGRKVPRVNGIAYHARPGEGVFKNCLLRVAKELGMGKLDFQNEPENSGIVELLEQVARRDELSQVHLTRDIERI